MKVGITLLELLITIAIIVTLTSLFVGGFSSFNRSGQLNSAVSDIATALKTARSKTISSEGPSSWGVHVESDRFILFQGLNFVSTSSTNTVFMLPGLVSASTSLANTTSNVVFLRPDGSTGNYGTITLSFKDQSDQRFVRIDQAGAVSVDTSPPPSVPLPNQDARHVHFSLGWDIRINTTMKLIFKDPPDADVIDNNLVSSCMNASNMVFDCTRFANVGGEDQLIRVHSHSLDAANTSLSVNRDARENTKAVEVWFDSTLIATYDVAGNVTKGPDVLIGEPQIQ